MPMQLLERLLCERLPVNIESDADIGKCVELVAEKLIEADIPSVVNTRGLRSYSGHAIVMRVTRKGQAASGKQLKSPPGAPARP